MESSLLTEKELLGIVDGLIRDAAYNRPAAVAIGMAVGAAVEAEVRERLRAENAALKREAHTWWEAARDATKAETERCALVAALHSQYPVTTDYDMGYAKARADAAAAIRVGPNAELTCRPGLPGLSGRTTG